MSRRIVFAAFAAVLLLWPCAGQAKEPCPMRPACHGCGCKGGPGYRGPKGCVGFKDLEKVCGTPPTTRCVFENAPGTGANRECALGPKSGTASKRGKTKGGAPEPADDPSGEPAPSAPDEPPR